MTGSFMQVESVKLDGDPHRGSRAGCAYGKANLSIRYAVGVSFAPTLLLLTLWLGTDASSSARGMDFIPVERSPAGDSFSLNSNACLTPCLAKPI